MIVTHIQPDFRFLFDATHYADLRDEKEAVGKIASISLCGGAFPAVNPMGCVCTSCEHQRKNDYHKQPIGGCCTDFETALIVAGQADRPADVIFEVTRYAKAENATFARPNRLVMVGAGQHTMAEIFGSEENAIEMCRQAWWDFHIEGQPIVFELPPLAEVELAQ